MKVPAAVTLWAVPVDRGNPSGAFYLMEVGVMACIAKRRDRWVVDFYDNQGKRRWKTLPKGITKGKAKEAMREIEDQVKRGIYIPDKKIPVFKTVAKNWLEQKKLNVRESYWSTCEGITRNHFAEINDLKVNRINISTVEKWISKRQKDGVHIQTLRKLLMVFGQIMAYAVRHRHIEYNPVRDAERPNDRGKVKKKAIRVLIPTEMKAFLNEVEDLKYKTLFRLAIMSGARQGELLGLKWSDIDWDNSQIHIQRTFNNQKWYDVKTETSDRKIDLGPAMMAELKKWKVACLPNRLNLVFPNEAGQPTDHSNMRGRHFYPALEKAGIKKIRFHDLRHTYASLLIEQGENIKYIQDQLGHSTPTVTLNVYAHLMKSTNQEAAIRLEKAIF